MNKKGLWKLDKPHLLHLYPLGFSSWNVSPFKHSMSLFSILKVPLESLEMHLSVVHRRFFFPLQILLWVKLLGPPGFSQFHSQEVSRIKGFGSRSKPLPLALCNTDIKLAGCCPLRDVLEGKWWPFCLHLPMVHPLHIQFLQAHFKHSSPNWD